MLIFLFMSIKVCLKSRVSCEVSSGAWLPGGLCECTHVSSAGSLLGAVEVIVKTSKVLDKRKNFLLTVPLSSSYSLPRLFQSSSVDIFKSSGANFPRVYTLKNNQRDGLQMI